MSLFPAYVTVLLVTASAVAGIFYAKALRKKGVNLSSRLSLRDVPMVAALTLVLLCVVLPMMWIRTQPLLYWHLPVAVQSHESAALWTYILSFLAFIAGGLFSVRQSIAGRAIGLLCTALLALFADTAIRRSPFLRPVQIESPRVEDGVVLQTSDATCAAAACANVLQALGVAKSEEEMVKLLGTTTYGTSVAQVVRGLETLGYTVTRKLVARQSPEVLDPPALLFVDFGVDPLGHVVTYMGMQNGHAEIWNPQGGKSFLPPEQLAMSWRGHALEVRREAD